MPLILPDQLPAIGLLEQENIFVECKEHVGSLQEAPLRILILNLMPLKIETETDLVRLFSNSPKTLELTFLRMSNHISKHTPAAHMDRFYTVFSAVKDSNFDGMIITGAPVEHLDFEEVTYWKELTEIFEWSRLHVSSVFHICWAAQAALYHHYGIPKYPMAQKMFGVFQHQVLDSSLPVFRGFDDTFFAPHSRHTEVHATDIQAKAALKLLAVSEEAGVYMVMAREGREFYVMGHSEYNPFTLDGEYRRDLAKGLPIQKPRHYYRDDNPDKGPWVRWRAHANLLFNNWINYYVCSQAFSPIKTKNNG